jgi:L-arabinose isomerase
MQALKQMEVWFLTGSQNLYGAAALAQVTENARRVADSLAGETSIPVTITFKSIVTTPDNIRSLCREANSAENWIGLIRWMHTFSPAKMWIAGLHSLLKPLLHLHTQFNRDLPWSTRWVNFGTDHGSDNGAKQSAILRS